MPDESGGDRQAQLLEAYADACLLWTKVVGSSLALSGALIERGEWEDVRALAGLLAAAGEESAATELRIRLGGGGLGPRIANSCVRSAITCRSPQSSRP